MGSAPERSCVVCRTKLPQAELTRWAIVDGAAVRNRAVGRGYYSCADHIDKAPQVIMARAERRNNG